MSDITLNLHDKKSIVALLVDVQEAEISCLRAATEIQKQHNAAMDALNAAHEKTHEELDNLKASTIHSCGDSCSRPMCVLRRERDELREELERERMRLAACGVVADANTPESAKKWRNMRDEYRSASCYGVARAVDREMWLRREMDAYKEYLKYIYSICEDKTIELPDDDYAKVTIDECIMEAERAMQKCKKMEGESK